MPNLASPKAVQFLNTLASSRVTASFPWLPATLAAAQAGKATSFQVSKAIDSLKAAPWLTPKAPGTAQDAPKADLVPVGFYSKEGIVYKVREGKADPSRRYALAFQVTGAKGGYAFAKGAMAKLTLADKLTLAEAARMGHQTGCCCICGRELTDPSSIAMGIGPVCIEKAGF